MKDVHGPGPSVSQAAARHVESATWRKGAKWFASEFVVVVAGILVALGLQAWWQDRQDSSRGLEYLPAYLAAWPRLQADEQFRTAQQWRLFAGMKIEYYRQEILNATTALRTIVETSER